MAKKIFAILTIFALAAVASPALADGNDRVSNRNEGAVVNSVEAKANTGGNWAGGSSGGDGGNGGPITNNDEGDVEESSTGNGGRGGSGSEGGTIVTGNASAEVGVANVVNSNDTVINRCACDGDEEDGNTRVRNRNSGAAINAAVAGANSGENGADGSYGGDGGNGGAVTNNGEGDVEESSTGSGNSGGNGGAGGFVQSGNASSRAGVVNVINSNITRVRR